MPIPARSMKTTTCQSCGLNTVTHQLNDVLFLLSQCERCGSEQLKYEAEGRLERLNPVSVILDSLKRMKL